MNVHSGSGSNEISVSVVTESVARYLLDILLPLQVFVYCFETDIEKEGCRKERRRISAVLCPVSFNRLIDHGLEEFAIECHTHFVVG